jgi:hypothetical protein
MPEPKNIIKKIQAEARERRVALDLLEEIFVDEPDGLVALLTAREQLVRGSWSYRFFGRLSAWQLWSSIWIWSWDPQRSRDAIRRTASALLGQDSRQGKTPKRASAAPSFRSNAPIKHGSQSILSKIVAQSAMISHVRVRILLPQPGSPSFREFPSLDEKGPPNAGFSHRQ